MSIDDEDLAMQVAELRQCVSRAESELVEARKRLRGLNYMSTSGSARWAARIWSDSGGRPRGRSEGPQGQRLRHSRESTSSLS